MARDCAALSTLVHTLSVGGAATDTPANPAVADSAAIIKLTQEFDSRLRAVEKRLTEKLTASSTEVDKLQTLVKNKVTDLTKKIN